MSSDISDENLSECPWETGLSPRARRIGLAVSFLAILVIILFPKLKSLWERRGFLSGTVTLDGQPLANARVHIRYVYRPPPGWRTSFPNRPFDRPHFPDDDHETTTDATGNYRFSFILPRTYDLWVQHPAGRFPWHRYGVKIEPGFQTYDIALTKQP